MDYPYPAQPYYEPAAPISRPPPKNRQRQSSAEDSEDKTGQRKRTVVACGRCRAKKIKCDGGLPKCNHCSKSKHDEICDYVAVSAEQNLAVRSRRKLRLPGDEPVPKVRSTSQRGVGYSRSYASGSTSPTSSSSFSRPASPPDAIGYAPIYHNQPSTPMSPTSSQRQTSPRGSAHDHHVASFSGPIDGHFPGSTIHRPTSLPLDAYFSPSFEQQDHLSTAPRRRSEPDAVPSVLAHSTIRLPSPQPPRFDPHYQQQSHLPPLDAPTWDPYPIQHYPSTTVAPLGSDVQVFRLPHPSASARPHLQQQHQHQQPYSAPHQQDSFILQRPRLPHSQSMPLLDTSLRVFDSSLPHPPSSARQVVYPPTPDPQAFYSPEHLVPTSGYSGSRDPSIGYFPYVGEQDEPWFFDSQQQQWGAGYEPEPIVPTNNWMSTACSSGGR